MPAYWRPGPYYLLPGRRAVDSHPAPFRSAIQLPGVPPGYHWVTPPVESTTAHAARPLPITTLQHPYRPGQLPRTKNQITPTGPLTSPHAPIPSPNKLAAPDAGLLAAGPLLTYSIRIGQDSSRPRKIK